MRLKGCFLFLVCINLGTSLAAQVTWRRAYGAFGSDVGKCVRTTVDGHIVVAGSTGSFGDGNSDIYLFELDGNGALQWSRTIGGPMVEQATSLVRMPNSDWLIIGFTNSTSGAGGYDGLLVRTDANGEVLWQRTYGGADWDLFQGGSSMPDGGAIIAGQTFSEGTGGDAWLVRITEEGDTLWTHHFGNQNSDMANAVIHTTDGGFAFVGSINGSDNDENAFVVKLDDQGTWQWEQSIGGDSLDLGRDIVQTQDGGFSIVGATHSFSQYSEHYHFKLGGSGLLQWQNHWGQVNDQEAYQHVELPSGDFATTGWTKTSGGGGKDMFIFLCNSQGDFISQHTYGGAADDEGFSLDTIAGGFVACGATTSFGAGGNDVFVVRTDEDANTATEDVITDFDPLSVDVHAQIDTRFFYPNPSVGAVGLLSPTWQQVTLFDATGRALRLWHRPGSQLDISNMTEGTYILRATDVSGRVITAPLVLLKH